ncbi:MAG: LysR substrate-binding domain-containing protein [Alphaproteobacteria bacterium]|nr:LysR substrate-binding domain-containing protein [Alphaproteobacteria bacterium]
MTLRELRYLVALADHGHFGRAAEACHVSQPTLSTQLKKLEEYLGAALFERTNKALHITPIGEQIVAKARRVLAEADTIVELASQKVGPLTGPLNLGVIPTLSPYLLPWLLPALKGAYPDLRLVVHEDLTDHLLERLKAHRIDAALLALPIKEEELETLPLFDEPFFVACPPSHRLAKAKSVRTSDLRKVHLLLLTDGHCLREQALAVCGFDEAPAEDDGTDFRATSLETIRQMVAAGIGCTLLPAMALGSRQDRRLEFRPITGEASRRIGLVWRRSYPKTADLESLADVIRNALPPAVRAA